ncbi:chromatin-remodeling ATPase INO80 isoform X2 [Phymastichus coffea]|uniref:chromatin-remodeling ATPase INO80 isoform X2 n=1 Tax=Phymastichus coffea TaxID=108790 RepID=UPI00273B88C8|nr:chromatin-remodeling ATPase INO80 isoform X2 [Phymastichus coffea]
MVTQTGMTDRARAMGLEVEMAAPLHLQRLERSLNIQPFLNQVNELFKDQMSEEEESSEQESIESDSELNDSISPREEKKNNKLRVYNMSNVGEERQWLRDILVSDASDSSSSESDSDNSITEEDFQDMLKAHLLKKKYQARFYQKPENIQYQYYGAGLLSNHDRFLEHQQMIVGNKKKKEKKVEKKIIKVKKEKTAHYKGAHENKDQKYSAGNWDKSRGPDQSEGSELELTLKHQPRGRGRKKHINKSPEVMAIRRRKIWMMMSKKELGKVQRAKINNHKEMLISCKKVAQHCMKYWRQKAMQSQKNMKETIWRQKRLTREMQSYWKRYDRVERETRKRLEKEAEEQRKMDVELIEAKRQQRKLNFLITQTELYAHFMSRKMGKASPEEQLRILNQLDEEKNPRLAGIDDYDSELMKQKAKKNAMDAFDNERARSQQFDPANNQRLTLSDTPENMEHPQPSIFKGMLKGYQLKGMNWLANLYDQGISGILADEMGLGKTVQSIAFLCHIAEKYSVWGPFLIISPASTLHNWQQEMARFVPDFKVVPYWGNPQERKILRQFWDTKDLHTKEASFHVVITSYQLVITDYKYFNRIKWQYLILDEAQAIKSTSSMRWKLLLGFSCRNRLLLSGTPIQNSMAELWALLHFIMPTLFDSHDEFNEWFSKDIESHAENKTGIDEKHLSRLHMILKPFMLRRIKKDVENELSDKIEIMVYCPLTTRQKLLYKALKKKIRIEDLLHYSVGDSAINDKNFTSNLMNLVMQFRKVCNHPELFERRDAKSPYFMRTELFELPSLLFKGYIFNPVNPSKEHLLYNKFFLFASEYIHRSLFDDIDGERCFSFSRFSNLSATELNSIFIGGILFRLLHAWRQSKVMSVKQHWEDWYEDESFIPSNISWLLTQKLNSSSQAASDLIFTRNILNGDAVHTHTTHMIHSMPETVAHRILRSSKKANQPVKLQRAICSVKVEQGEELKVPLLPEHPHVSRPSIARHCQLTMLPSFVCDNIPKVIASSRKVYMSHCSAARAWRRHEECGGLFAKKFTYQQFGGLAVSRPLSGWSNIIVPDKQTLVTDAGKLAVLDNLLKRLKEQGHRVLIYSQMTKMIDLLEEYMYHRKHTFMRLDGSSKISDRRDMVADFQKRADIFVFLLSTRAGGLGINLTAADTVIFYDSDWNPTVDQQAMDRAHRLGQTKQVTVYRLICKGTIEERILQRAREKSEIQRMVISGGNFKPDTLKPKEVVSLLLDDEEIEAKYSQRSEERKLHAEEARANAEALARDRKRKQTALPVKGEPKRICLADEAATDFVANSHDSTNFQQQQSNHQAAAADEFDQPAPLSPKSEDETSNEGLVVDVDGPVNYPTSSSLQFSRDFSEIRQFGQNMGMRTSMRGASKRGRPRGSRGKTRGVVTLHQHFKTLPAAASAMAGTGIPASASHGSADQQSASSASASIYQSSTSSHHHHHSPSGKSMSGIRRGPGRPRLRPNGPGNQGYRVHSLQQKRPSSTTLPVPIRVQPGSSTSGASGEQQQQGSSSRPFGFYTQQQGT